MPTTIDKFARTAVRGVPMDFWQAQITLKLLARFPNLIITQGPWSDAEASAGTHNGAGVEDLYLNGHDPYEVLRYAFEIGFFGWYRPTLPGVWKAHLHLGVRGHPGMAQGLKAQQVSWTNKRNGLKGNGPDSFTYRPKNYREAAPFEQPEPPTTLRAATFNFPGTDKLPNLPARIAGAMGLLKSQSLHMVAWQELEGITRRASAVERVKHGPGGVASGTARAVDTALGKKWGLVRPTTLHNENYLSYRSDVIEVVHQYDDSILESKRGNRHITRVVLRYRKTGFVFAVGIVHLLNGNTEADERERQSQAADADVSMRAVTGKHDGCPRIILGDMNTTHALAAFVASQGKGARRYADVSTSRNDSTFTPYDDAAPTRTSTRIYDQVYLWGLYVVRYDVLRAIVGGKYRRPRPSDHDPVLVEFRSN